MSKNETPTKVIVPCRFSYMWSGLDRKKIQPEKDGQQEPDMVQRLLQS